MLTRYAFHQSQVEAPKGNILLHALVQICFKHLLTAQVYMLQKEPTDNLLSLMLPVWNLIVVQLQVKIETQVSIDMQTICETFKLMDARSDKVIYVPIMIKTDFMKIIHLFVYVTLIISQQQRYF